MAYHQSCGAMQSRDDAPCPRAFFVQLRKGHRHGEGVQQEHAQGSQSCSTQPAGDSVSLVILVICLKRHVLRRGLLLAANAEAMRGSKTQHC